MSDQRAEVPYGTLDLLVLRTLDSMGRTHGYGIARRIEQAFENLLQLNQGSIYPALLRLQQRGWVKAAWGQSEHKRQAKFYEITDSGRDRLRQERENWEHMTGLISRFLGAAT